jgi:hypothetical protein
MVHGIVAGRLALVTGEKYDVHNYFYVIIWTGFINLVMIYCFTGAGSGIGRAACQVLSREGATVIAADRNYDSAMQTIKTHTALASGYNGIRLHFELKYT